MAVEKNIMLKKGKQYHPPYNIRLLGRISSGERGKGTEVSGKKIKI